MLERGGIENVQARSMKLSVVIPTYRRAESLNRCLEGLHKQIRPADEILVVTQTEDDESSRLLESWSEWPVLKKIQQPAGGAVSQYNSGLDASKGEVIAVTDDDAVPRPDWLLRIERYFMEFPDLGGVGGRDFVRENGVELHGDAHLIGVVQPFGRIVHNHHIGTRLLTNVDILKGVNMAFRAVAIGDLRFDTSLRGNGAQTCLDMAFSFGVQKRGWRLLYDPEVAVDHYPARRFDADQRGAPSIEAIENNSFNIYLTLRRHMRRGLRRRAALSWANWIGVERSPGILRGLVSGLKGDRFGIEMRQATKRAWVAAQRSA
jgi:cellulose synthase/poly-beta-1,6-N-acetylglucosamine synthase-like glycosyltransferase